MSTSFGALLLHDRGDEAVGVVLHRRELGVGRRDRRGLDGRVVDRRGCGLHERSSVLRTLSDPSARIPGCPIPPRPPVAPARPTTLAPLRRRARRPVVLAARTRRPRRARLPRSRERVHRGVARRTPGRSASGCTTEIVGSGPGDRRVGAGAARRLRVLLADHRGPAVRRALPAPGRHSRAPRPDAPPGTTPGETVVLDENALAAGHDYFAVGDLAVNPAQTLAAYTTDTTGGERYDLRFRDLDDGRRPSRRRDRRVLRRRVGERRPHGLLHPPRRRDAAVAGVATHLGTTADDDVLVFQEDDDRFFVSVGRAPAPAACS